MRNILLVKMTRGKGIVKYDGLWRYYECFTCLMTHLMDNMGFKPVGHVLQSDEYILRTQPVAPLDGMRVFSRQENPLFCQGEVSHIRFKNLVLGKEDESHS